MGIKDFFMRLLKNRNNRPLLPEGRTNPLDEYRMPEGFIKTEPSFEECIDEFMKQYNNSGEIEDIAYRSFRRMFCNNEEPAGNNLEAQEKLKKLVNKKGYQIVRQVRGERLAFLQISGEYILDQYKDRDMKRIYINCERKDIATLAALIFKNIYTIAGEKLSMKFVAEQESIEGMQAEEKRDFKNYQRNDKIVIYVENSEKAEQIAQKINEIRLKYPKFFANSKQLPFLPKRYGVIGITDGKPPNAVKTPVNWVMGKTPNDFMADLLYQSIISGFDLEFGINSATSNISGDERMKQYKDIYGKLLPEQKNSLIEHIRGVFETACRVGEINTPYTPQQEQSQNVRAY